MNLKEFLQKSAEQGFKWRYIYDLSTGHVHLVETLLKEGEKS